MRLGFIALLSGDLFSGQTSFHRQFALPVDTARPARRSNCDRLSGSNQSNYCRKSPTASIRAWKLHPGTTDRSRQQITQRSFGDNWNTRETKVPQPQSSWPFASGFNVTCKNRNFKLMNYGNTKSLRQAKPCDARTTQRACRPRKVRPRAAR